MVRRSLGLGLILAALSGCDLSLTGAVISCADGSGCPTGQACVGGLCQAASSGGATGTGTSGGSPGSSSSGSSSATSGATGGSTAGGTTGSTTGGTTGGTSTTGGTGAGSTGAPPFTELSLYAGQPGGLGNTDGIGLAARFYGPRGVVADGHGNAYVADSDNHTIRRVSLATDAVTTIAGAADGGSGNNIDGVGSAARFDLPEGILWDGQGDLYVSDYNQCTIRKIVVGTATVTTISGDAGVCADQASPPTFNHPVGLAYDGTNLYIGEESGQTLRALNLDSGVVTTVAGSGDTGLVNDPGTAASFDEPDWLAYDAGFLYVADDVNAVVRQVGCSSPFSVSTCAGTSTPGYADGEVLTVAEFYHPHGLSFDEAGNLYLVDWTQTVRQISGGNVTTVAGAPLDAGSSNGIGSAARFDNPEGLAYVDVDGGQLLIAEIVNDTLRKVQLVVGDAGVVSTLAGVASGAGTANGSAVNASFSGPRGMVYDGKSTLYVADVSDTIRAINLNSSAVTTLTGTPNVPGDTDGTLAQATFNTPWDLAYDPTNLDLYVSENPGEHLGAIRRIALDGGAVSIVAGNGLNATFDEPRGLALDGQGNLYVSDCFDNQIREIALSSGTTTLFAGSASGTAGSTDNTGTSASFWQPSGLTYDGIGNLYVADTGNQSIRKLVLANAKVTTVATVTGGGGEDPIDLIYAAPGSLYVSSRDDATVQLVDIASGAVTTIVGIPWVQGLQVGTLPGVLNIPWGLALVPGQGLFISDFNENVIVRAK
jgi:hypothetical protein